MKIKRTKEFYQASRQISDFIKGLPLSTEDNDKLVHNLVEYTNTVERSAALFRSAGWSAACARLE